MSVFFIGLFVILIVTFSVYSSTNSKSFLDAIGYNDYNITLFYVSEAGLKRLRLRDFCLESI